MPLDTSASSGIYCRMEYRLLGGSGLKVPVICFGTGTFGGKGEFFKAWGETDVKEASRLIDVCLEAGVNFFDTADIYSQGMSEEILGKALAGRRDKVLISTKATFRIGDGTNDLALRATTSCGSARRACAASARITSISIICTASTRSPPSKRRSTR